MTGELVHVSAADGVATVTLDSPANRNALSSRLVAELYRAIRGAIDDEAVRVIVLTGAGPVFCSGADLKERLAALDEANPRTPDPPPAPHGSSAHGASRVPDADRTEDSEQAGHALDAVAYEDVLALIWNSPKPVVGRVNGPARAGGIGLIAACDIAVAPLPATFGFSEVRIGVVPAIIAVTCLRRMDPRAANEYFLTGDTFDGGRAREIGLLNRAVPPGELDATIRHYTDMLLRGAPEALAAAKDLVRTVPGLTVTDGFTRMAELSARRFASAEGQEGMRAFAERRDPAWVPPDLRRA